MGVILTSNVSEYPYRSYERHSCYRCYCVPAKFCWKASLTYMNNAALIRRWIYGGKEEFYDLNGQSISTTGIFDNLVKGLDKSWLGLSSSWDQYLDFSLWLKVFDRRLITQSTIKTIYPNPFPNYKFPWGQMTFTRVPSFRNFWSSFVRWLPVLTAPILRFSQT